LSIRCSRGIGCHTNYAQKSNKVGALQSVDTLPQVFDKLRCLVFEVPKNVRIDQSRVITLLHELSCQTSVLLVPPHCVRNTNKNEQQHPSNHCSLHVVGSRYSTEQSAMPFCRLTPRGKLRARPCSGPVALLYEP